MKILREQDGFTLAELIIAMAVFSGMLVIVSQGFLGIVKLQQAGVVQRDTQQNARLALEQIARDARVANNAVPGAPAPAQPQLCLKQASQAILYYVSPFPATTASPGRLYRSPNPAGDCITQAGSAVTSDDVSLVNMVSSVTTNAPQSVSAALTITSKDISQLNNTNPYSATACSPGAGSQFCSLTTLTTTVSLQGS